MSIDLLDALAMQLSKLPGIGRKTAQRLAYHIIDMPKTSAKELAASISAACEGIYHCPVCGNYTETTPCAICLDKTRDEKLLCVVKEAHDVLSMEKLREFRGKYHVLGGTLSPMSGVGPDDIRIRELEERVKRDGVNEVIIATNPDVEGEATAAYIARLLKPLNVRVTRIAHGIPMGGNLDYVDEMTLLKAIEGRRDM